MTYLKTCFQIGSKTFSNNIFYAPLAGCSDFPFRQMSAKYRPGLMYCEMVKMDALIRYDQNTFHMLDYDKSMHPIGAQLCGSKPELAGPAARILEELGFDVIDLNCGCPVDKITKDGSGSGLLKNPQLIGELVSNICAAVKVPVTLKIRAGWDEEHINAAEITRIAEEAGAVAICVHGRTREQAYRGVANRDYIRACKEAARTIKVIGNGDILDVDSAKHMFEYTGCDAILVARGTMGHPWIVEDILRGLNGEAVVERSIEECRQALYEHFLMAESYYTPRRIAIEMRRIGCWYLKKTSGTKEFREKISRAENLSVVRDLILNFNPADDKESHSDNEGANDSLVELYTIVTGRVQKVGFRAAAQKIGQKYGIVGYAKNLADGSVEICVQAKKTVLKLFLSDLKEGLAQYIDDVKVTYRIPTLSLKNFDIN